MSKKILISLIIFGIIFLGSATYALFNENLLLNDVASDIQTNDTTQSNNQPNIQNNPDNIQNNQSSNIIRGENSNLIHNNVANVILNGIGDNSVVNGTVGQKVVKEVSRFTINNQTHIMYDDYSYVMIMNNETYTGQEVRHVVDTDTEGGYVFCSDCGNYIPVGKVSGVVSENYLCHCPDEHSTNVNDYPWIYSEESIIQDTWLNDIYYKALDNSNIDSADAGNINIPDEVNL